MWDDKCGNWTTRLIFFLMSSCVYAFKMNENDEYSETCTTHSWEIASADEREISFRKQEQSNKINRIINCILCISHSWYSVFAVEKIEFRVLLVHRIDFPSHNLYLSLAMMLWRKIEFFKLQLLWACSSRLFSLIKRPRSIDNVYVKRLNAESSFPSHSSQNFSSYIRYKIDMSITHDIHTANPKENSFNLIPVLSSITKGNWASLLKNEELWRTDNRMMKSKAEKLKIRKWIKTFYRFDDNFLPPLDIYAILILMLH